MGSLQALNEEHKKLEALGQIESENKATQVIANHKVEYNAKLLYDMHWMAKKQRLWAKKHALSAWEWLTLVKRIRDLYPFADMQNLWREAYKLKA